MRLILTVALLLAGCVTTEGGVRVEASPRPPHLYWAPPGSTVVNHARDERIWIAQDEFGHELAYYFGDACGASRWQAYVGRPLADLPSEGTRHWRWIGPDDIVTADLNFARTSVAYGRSGDILEIKCG